MSEQRLPALDGLRGFAALIVAVSHFSNYTNILGGKLGFGAGQLGVMLFFALSGFLMGWLYVPAQLTIPAVITFLRRRFARVVPLYILIVLISFFWTTCLAGYYEPPYRITEANIWDHLLFVKGTSVLWTIPVEVQFYVLFPLLWLIGTWSRRSLVLLSAAVIVVVAILGFPAPVQLVPYLPFFLGGLMLSVVPEGPAGRWREVLFLLALAMFIIAFPNLRNSIGIGADIVVESSGGRTVWHSPVYLLLTIAVLWTSLRSNWAAHLFANPVSVHLGAISYSFYLLHKPILLGLGSFPIVAANHWLFLMVFLIATVGLATLSWRFIEVPARRALTTLRSSDAARNLHAEAAN